MDEAEIAVGGVVVTGCQSSGILEYFRRWFIGIHDRQMPLEVGGFSPGRRNRYGQAQRIDAEMDQARQATFREAKTLTRSPPLAPAEQRCTRIMVLSIICKLGLPPPLSLNASSSNSHRPDSVQRRNWR